jgi:hypothetical protein
MNVRNLTVFQFFLLSCACSLLSLLQLSQLLGVGSRELLAPSGAFALGGGGSSGWLLGGPLGWHE